MLHRLRLTHKKKAKKHKYIWDRMRMCMMNDAETRFMNMCKNEGWWTFDFFVTVGGCFCVSSVSDSCSKPLSQYGTFQGLASLARLPEHSANRYIITQILFVSMCSIMHNCESMHLVYTMITRRRTSSTVAEKSLELFQQDGNRTYRKWTVGSDSCWEIYQGTSRHLRLLSRTHSRVHHHTLKASETMRLAKPSTRAIPSIPSTSRMILLRLYQLQAKESGISPTLISSPKNQKTSEQLNLYTCVYGGVSLRVSKSGFRAKLMGCRFDTLWLRSSSVVLR